VFPVRKRAKPLKMSFEIMRLSTSRHDTVRQLLDGRPLRNHRSLPPGRKVGFSSLFWNCSILRCRLDTDAIVDCVTNSLLATEIFLSRLDRNMSKQKLDLLQFAASNVAQARTRAAEIMWR